METQVLARWRDVALLILATEVIGMSTLVGVVLYRVLQVLRPVPERVRPILFELRMTLWRVQQTTQRTTGAIARPCVRVQAAGAGVVRFLQYLCRRRG